MKKSALLSSLAFLLTLVSPIAGQSLTPSWEYTYTESAPGKQIANFTPINSGSDGSAAFVATRGDGAGGFTNSEIQIFWLRPNADGSSPTAPLWVSGWVSSSAFYDVIAVRRNHLVYVAGRELRSVVVDDQGAITETTVKTFTGDPLGADLVFTAEQPRGPGFIFSADIGDDNTSFTFSAFRFEPAPFQVSGVPTFSTINGNNLSVSFQTQEGINYRLQSSTTLSTDSWQNVGSAIAGTGDVITVLQPAGVPKLFYRVVAL